MKTKEKIILSAILIALGVACRLLPHFWNFAPVAAVALFSGAYLGRRYAIFNPLAVMVIGDLFIGFYEPPLMIAVYASFAVIGLIGECLKKQRRVETVLAASLAGSVIFFLASNWAVWQFSSWYDKTAAGLWECLALALPFYRNTLLGDLFYTGVFFGAYELVRSGVFSHKSVLAAKTLKS
jgi:hypothetical protein